MNEEIHEIVIRSVHCTTEGEFLDGVEEANDEIDRALLAEFDVKDPEELSEASKYRQAPSGKQRHLDNRSGLEDRTSLAEQEVHEARPQHEPDTDTDVDDAEIIDESSEYRQNSEIGSPTASFFQREQLKPEEYKPTFVGSIAPCPWMQSHTY